MKELKNEGMETEKRNLKICRFENLKMSNIQTLCLCENLCAYVLKLGAWGRGLGAGSLGQGA